MYRILIILVMLTMILPSSFAQDEPDTVKIQILPFLALAPFYVAEEAGFYDEYNIDLEIVEFDNSASALPALIQGELDVTLGYLNFGAINALDRGANLKIIASYGFEESDDSCRGTAFFVSNSSVESIQTPADLAGRTIYLQSGVPEYYLETLLSQANLSLDDVELDYVPSPARLDGLLSGSIEVTQMSEPWYTRTIQNDAGIPLFDFDDILPDSNLGVITVSESLLNRPDVATRFLIATQMGMQKYSEGPTEENLDMVATFTGLDRELLSQVCWRRSTLLGETVTDGLDAYLAWAFDKEFVDFLPEAGQYFDATFIEAANEVMPFLEVEDAANDE